MEKAPDNKQLAKSDIPFPWESEIGRRLTMGDVCYYAPGMLNKIGKEGKTSWDSFSYALMMAHNVNSHISSVQRANQLMDIEIAKVGDKIDWRYWRAVKANDSNFDQYSDWVPRNILYFADFIEDLFNAKSKKEAFDMIDDGINFLRSLEGTRSQDGKARNTFFTHFDVEDEIILDKSVSPVFATPVLDEDKLLDLEDELGNEDV